MENKGIVFTEPNIAKLINSEMKTEIGRTQVKVKTSFSTVSCGTEKANITGDPNVAVDEKGVVLLPRQLGYSSSGIVIEVGEEVTSVKSGDRVVMYWSRHSEYNILDEENVIKIEDENVSM